MNPRFLHRLSLFWKLSLLFIILISVVALTIFIFIHEVSGFIHSIQANPTIVEHVQLSLMRLYGLCCLFGFALIMLFYWDLGAFIKRLNNCLKDALTDRKLAAGFSEFYKGKTFDDIVNNIASLFSLFKSFENMKSGKISLDTNTIKSLLNYVNEGVLIVDHEKIVTHINYTGEQMLGLLPGEMLGQTLSRKISSEVLLESLDEAILKDYKVTEKKLMLKEDKEIGVQILPIKNKFGEVLRALIILKRQNDIEEKL